VSELIEPSFKIADFCKAEGISLATYHKMRKAGHGPQEMRVPNTTIVRITPEARKEWHERLKQLAATPSAMKFRRKIETRARNAGKAAIASPKHPSRSRKQQKG
jgi:hypothetical protein